MVNIYIVDKNKFNDVDGLMSSSKKFETNVERKEKPIQNQLRDDCPNKRNVNINVDAESNSDFFSCRSGMSWSLAL